jgi:3-methylcrotonyl-CoA carboxylase alpha subunit
MFNRILIANRGEIACRIQRTCQRLGIETVAVYSSADATSRHVAQADYAVAIGGPSPAESYLRADRIVQAALESGAQAIHPGYGFLSEKLELIDACAAHGIVFIGPHRAAIAAMGSKIESKRLARAAGLLCVPGFDGGEGDGQNPARLLHEAEAIGFPVLIKASAGGGGKGMRRVNTASEFFAQLILARQEAMAAFGDERVLLEKYIQNPRHLEVQLMGDRHGGLVHLFERECSVQRRFQKVIEEAPANHLPPALAEALYAFALAMGRAIGYDNAGTVEFVVDADDHGADAKPYFLEVNTRLQVEHPVTELTTGIDLVEWQLRVASGEALPLAQSQVRRSGWAIECRVNAEEPEHGYRASLGPVLGYAEPQRLLGVRVDSGLHVGSEVTPYYDAMLAKVIGFGPTRAHAKSRVQAGIEGLRIEGRHTNAHLLLQILNHSAFDEVLTTGFLDRHFANGPTIGPAEVQQRQQHQLAVATAWAAAQAVTAPVWADLRGFRVTAPSGHAAISSVWLRDLSQSADTEPGTGEVIRLTHNGPFCTGPVCTGPVSAGTSAPGQIVVHQASPTHWFSWLNGHTIAWEVRHALARPTAASGQSEHAQNLSATLPGRVTELRVHPGQAVTAGDPVLTLEAMKLFHSLAAPLTGTVRAIHVKTGDIVAHGALLVEFDINS